MRNVLSDDENMRVSLSGSRSVRLGYRNVQWRIQDLQTCAKVERRRREGAVGARMEAPKVPMRWGVGRECSLPTGKRVWKGVNVPSSEKVFDCGSQNVDFYCTLSAIFAVQLPVVHAKSTAFGLRKLATACKTTVKGGKASLETIRGNIVSFCV